MNQRALGQDFPEPMDYSTEIYRLNLTYLIAARDALLTSGQDYAEIAFGVSEPLLSWLRRASGSQIHELAGSSGLVFTLRLPLGRAGEGILAACASGREAALEARMHALQHMMLGTNACPAS